ncbi:MAG: hypothetical protein NC392_09535, partial [Roseburia sp.]|nr:hypothetical protein [Roseburia sp.]
TAERFSSQRTGMRAAGQNMVLEAYRASAASAVRNVKPAYCYHKQNIQRPKHRTCCCPQIGDWKYGLSISLGTGTFTCPISENGLLNLSTL